MTNSIRPMKVDTLPPKIIGLEDHPDLSFWDLVAFLGANSLSIAASLPAKALLSVFFSRAARYLTQKGVERLQKLGFSG